MTVMSWLLRIWRDNRGQMMGIVRAMRMGTEATMQIDDTWECTTETFLTSATDLGWSDVRISVYRRGNEYVIKGTARAIITGLDPLGW